MVTCLYADIGTRLLAYMSTLKVFFYCMQAEENTSKSFFCCFFCILVKFSHMIYIGDSLAEQAWYARMRNGAAKMEHI